MMRFLDLNAQELERVRAIIEKLKQDYLTADNHAFFKKSCYFSSLLPIRIRSFYRDLKCDPKHSGISLLRGFPFVELRTTPPSWDYNESYHPDSELDFFSVLVSSCVGHVFGWSTQQKGKIIHDLIPQQNRGGAQTGYGSTTELKMHTEDSFHSMRAEFICMYGIRNQSEVPTTLASIRDANLTSETKKILFDYRLKIYPDDSHLDNAQRAKTVHENLGVVSSIATLYGDRANPFLCFDPAYTDFESMDEEIVHAYKTLETEIDKITRDVSILPGEICIIDNRKVVHGRRAFFPSFDGNDRWLKRINISTNLRKSAAHRADIESRIIG